MGTIIAVGGGELRELETLPIDEEIVQRTGKRVPRVLFIPTASGDAVPYWNTFNKIYGRRLGCATDALYLIRDRPDYVAIERSILGADAVYVGGGNTLKMMRLWRRLGVDRILERAYRQGVVLSGLSAGAICWFRYGTSDSRRFYDAADETLIRVRGLGLLDAVLSPHHVSEPNRRQGLIDVMRRTSGVGLAVDDHAAIEIVGDRYRVLSSKPGVGIHRVYRRRGEIVHEPITERKEFLPLEGILRGDR